MNHTLNDAEEFWIRAMARIGATKWNDYYDVNGVRISDFYIKGYCLDGHWCMEIQRFVSDTTFEMIGLLTMHPELKETTPDWQRCVRNWRDIWPRVPLVDWKTKPDRTTMTKLLLML